MSLTDIRLNKDISYKIKTFFKEELIPKSIEIKKQKEVISWMDIDNNIDSYYEKKIKVSVNKVDFEAIGGSSLNTFESDLKHLWGNDNDSELMSLIPSLVDISKDLYSVSGQSESVSDYIYVMF